MKNTLLILLLTLTSLLFYAIAARSRENKRDFR